MCWVMRSRATGKALPNRFFSAVNLASNWRRRVSNAVSSWVAASGNSRGSGCTAAANGLTLSHPADRSSLSMPDGPGKITSAPGIDHHHRQATSSTHTYSPVPSPQSLPRQSVAALARPTVCSSGHGLPHHYAPSIPGPPGAHIPPIPFWLTSIPTYNSTAAFHL